MLIKKERLWALAKSHAIKIDSKKKPVTYRLSDGFLERLYEISQTNMEEHISLLVAHAMDRAEANNRKTLMAYDI